MEQYVRTHFLNHGLCAIAAIHTGINKEDSSRNNPHLHIIVTTRTVGPDGFSNTKDREYDKKEYIYRWRESWAEVINRAYERHGLDIRVDHRSFKEQGIDREPTNRLSYRDWQREKNGERTLAGDKKRAIKERNEKRNRERQLGKTRVRELG